VVSPNRMIRQVPRGSRSPAFTTRIASTGTNGSSVSVLIRCMFWRCMFWRCIRTLVGWTPPQPTLGTLKSEHTKNVNKMCRGAIFIRRISGKRVKLCCEQRKRPRNRLFSELTSLFPAWFFANCEQDAPRMPLWSSIKEGYVPSPFYPRSFFRPTRACLVDEMVW